MGRLSDSSPPQDSTEKPPPETEELYAAPQPAQDESGAIVVNPDRTRCETESKDDRKNAAEAEQAASLGNYFVCESTLMGSLMCRSHVYRGFFPTQTPRIESYSEWR